MVIEMSATDFDVINARFTFKNVPFHKLANFAFKDITSARESFKTIPGVSECVIVQTASRVEVFTVLSLEKGESLDSRRITGKSLIINKIKEMWLSLAELEQWDIDHIDQTLEVFRDADVYSHLLRLATGLDSLVVGKEEILDELKTSLSDAKQANTSGKVLNKLFETVFRLASKIRDSTEIQKDVISIGDVAVKVADENAGIDGKKKVLLIGTGETAALVAKPLLQKNHDFSVTSMNIERANGFSKILGGTPIDFEDVIAGFNKFDIVFVATTADYFLITQNKIKLVMESKKKGTMILDVSDPRAVEETVAYIPRIKLIFRDQIAELVEEALEKTKKKIPDVEKMILKEIPILTAAMKQT